MVPRPDAGYHCHSPQVDSDNDYDAEVLGISDDGGLFVRNVQTKEEKTLSGEEITVRPT